MTGGGAASVRYSVVKPCYESSTYRIRIALTFEIGSDRFRSNISIQIRPYDSSSYKALARLSPILIIDWS
jgi:hypothetical protein